MSTDRNLLIDNHSFFTTDILIINCSSKVRLYLLKYYCISSIIQKYRSCQHQHYLKFKDGKKERCSKMYASELNVIVKGSGFPQWKIVESMGAIE